MKKKINLNIVYWSTFVTLFLTYVVPCKHIDDLNKSFGFPFGWFRVHNNTIGDIIINSTAVNLATFVADIIVNYIIIWGVYKLYNNFRQKKRKQCSSL